MRPSRTQSRSCLLAVVLVLLDRGGGVVIQSLRHQLECQSVLVSAGLLDFGSFVLEPDFNLGFVEIEFLRERLSPLFGDVTTRLKFRFQPLELLCCERGARSFILLLTLLLLQLAGSGA